MSKKAIMLGIYTINLIVFFVCSMLWFCMYPMETVEKGKTTVTVKWKQALDHDAYIDTLYEIADEILKRSGKEVRVTVPGHTQRGGSPCPYDRVFASRLGSEAGKLILEGEYGFMVGYKNREVIKVPLEDVAGKLKMVSPDATIVKEAKMLGISFGD